MLKNCHLFVYYYPLCLLMLTVSETVEGSGFIQLRKPSALAQLSKEQGRSARQIPSPKGENYSVCVCVWIWKKGDDMSWKCETWTIFHSLQMRRGREGSSCKFCEHKLPER